MGVEIAKMDAKMQEIAKQADANKNDKLEKDEYSVFAQMATRQGISYREVSDALDMNAFQRWWYDVDKVSKDGKDDGKISVGEGALSFAKGLGGGIVKGIVKHPIKSLISVAAITGLSIVTGGAILPALAVAGVALGAGVAVAGIVQTARAKDDGSAKRGMETVGTGVATAVLSMLGIKSANKAAANAGVKSLSGFENENVFTNFGVAIKSMPEQMKIAGLNTKGNVLTWASAIKGDNVIYANSNATRNGVMTGTQAGNKVDDAYKIDLKGTPEEVLAKNPGLSYEAESGRYYVQTSWGEKSYINSDNYMFVQYGPNDCNAVEGAEFYDTYIDHTRFEATGAKRYINPEKLAPGEHVVTSKNAPARFKIVPEGTKYVSAEGEHTVQAGSVLRIDGQGRPYQSTVQFMLKKVTLTNEQVAELVAVDPVQAATTPVGKAFILNNTSASEAYLSQMGIEVKNFEIYQPGNLRDGYFDLNFVDKNSGTTECFYGNPCTAVKMGKEGPLASDAFLGVDNRATLLRQFTEAVMNGEIKK